VQERHPHRRVRTRSRGAGREYLAGGARCLPAAAAADPDDLDRVHHGRRAAGDLARRRRRNAPRHGRGGVLGHAGCDRFRFAAHPGVLPGNPQTRRGAPARSCDARRIDSDERNTTMNKTPSMNTISAMNKTSFMPKKLMTLRPARASRLLAGAALFATLGARAVGPTYHRPEAPAVVPRNADAHFTA